MSQSSDEAAVLAANAAFYAAFERLSIEDMDAVWAYEEPVLCVHPGWPLLSTREQVIESWRRIFENASLMRFDITGAQVVVEGDAAWVSCTENLTQVLDGRGGRGQDSGHQPLQAASRRVARRPPPRLGRSASRPRRSRPFGSEGKEHRAVRDVQRDGSLRFQDALAVTGESRHHLCCKGFQVLQSFAQWNSHVCELDKQVVQVAHLLQLLDPLHHVLRGTNQQGARL